MSTGGGRSKLLHDVLRNEGLLGGPDSGCRVGPQDADKLRAGYMDEPREIELKLEFDPAETEGVTRRASSALGAPREVARRLSSTYYDTRKHALHRRGVSLRLREDGDRRVQTLKASRGAGLLDRAEWESETTGDRPNIGAFPDGEPRRILKARGALDPVFETNVERTIWSVQEGASDVEIALDTGTVSAGGRQVQVAEVELELKHGSARDLFGIARRLAKDGQLRIGVRSKSERGYALLDGAARSAFKAEPVDLDPGMDAGAAFRAVARSCLRQFRLNEPLILESRDAAALHQARVAMRRLRSALSIFKDVADDQDFVRLRRGIRSVSTLLGEARDLDVYRAVTVAPEFARRPDLPGTAEYASRIDAKRDAAYGAVIRKLGSKPFRRFMVDLSAWIEAGPWLTRSESAEARGQDVRAFAAAELRRRRRAVRRKGRHLDALDAPARHRVRIAAKKLRYASEFFAELTCGRRAERRHHRFVARLETLQGVLGELNDIETGRGLAERIAEGRPGGEAPDIAFAAGHAVGEQDEREAALLRDAVKAHSRFSDAKPFWRAA